MISSLNHLTFAVRDLDESFRFYTDLLGFTPILKSASSAYLLAGTTWVALVLDPAMTEQPRADYSHAAFSIDDADIPVFQEQLEKAGIRIWQKKLIEGRSIYFLDPNGHKLELHASDLESRVAFARQDGWDNLHIFEKNLHLIPSGSRDFSLRSK